MTDEQWELIEIVIPPVKPGGRPREVNMREVINAMLYLSRSGCTWDMLPHDLPAKSTVYEYFSAWRDDGTWVHMLAVLREAYREVEAPSEEPTPSGASIDSQTVKTTECGGERGYKRHIVVDTLGLLLAVLVTSGGWRCQSEKCATYRKFPVKMHHRRDRPVLVPLQGRGVCGWRREYGSAPGRRWMSGPG